ncbi:MAG: FemAB family PEP-CTERM system-associated protein [Vicinamibacterales bacterium]
MEIIRCDASHDAAWNGFVQASPRASFYHRVEWRAINERCFGHTTAYLGAFDGGRLVGVLPLVRIKSLLFGNVACSMPFVNYGGPCGESDEVEQALMEAAHGVADEWNVDYLEIRSQRHLGERYPTSDHKVSMTIALDPDPEAVMGRFKRDQRAEIRRAAKNGFVTKFGPELVDDFYQVLSASWRDLGTPIYRVDFLKAVLDAFPQHTRVCVVYDAKGQPAAGAFDGIHNGTVEGMWLGMRAEYRRQLVGYVLYWELIKHACELGCQSFHLGRSSKDSGGEQFKKKWNAEAMQLYWQYILRTRREMPSLNPDNPRYKLAIQAWRKLPLPMTQMIGPFIARSIP